MTVLANCFHCGKAVLVRKETLAANKPSYCVFCRNVLGSDAPDRGRNGDGQPNPGPARPPRNDPDPGMGQERVELRDWVVQCYAGGRWTDSPAARMGVAIKGDVLELTNTTGIHDHAGVVTRRRLEGDYTARVEVRGAKSAGLKSANGDFAWAGVDNLDDGDWKAVVLT